MIVTVLVIDILHQTPLVYVHFERESAVATLYEYVKENWSQFIGSDAALADMREAIRIYFEYTAELENAFFYEGHIESLTSLSSMERIDTNRVVESVAKRPYNG